MDNLGIVFLSELVGTALLVLLGCGVVANVALTKNKGFGALPMWFMPGLSHHSPRCVAHPSGPAMSLVRRA